MHRSTISSDIKREVGRVCCNCGKNTDVQYHHIIPFSLGGKDDSSNIVALCHDCHMKAHGIYIGRYNHSELIKDGIKKAKAEGRRIGRKSREDDVVKAICEYSSIFHEEGLTNLELCEMLDLKPTCIAKYQRKVIEAYKSEWTYSDIKRPERLVRTHSAYTICERRRRHGYP